MSKTLTLPSPPKGKNLDWVNDMDKQAFINEYHQFLDESGLSVDQVQVGAGGIMLMLGMRDTTGDLDLELSEKIFYRLVEERGLEIVDNEMGLVEWDQFCRDKLAELDDDTLLVAVDCHI